MRQPSNALRTPVDLQSLEPRLLLSVDPTQYQQVMAMVAASLAASGNQPGGAIQGPATGGTADTGGAIFVPGYDAMTDYDWWFGCAPTAAGMLLDWWEVAGGADIYPGDPSHWLFGQYPATTYGPYSVPDAANGAVGGWWQFYDDGFDWHTPDSLADYMQVQNLPNQDNWAAFLDAWWGLNNYVAWDDPRTAENESFVDAVALDWITDNYWDEDPNVDADDLVPAGAALDVPFALGADPLGRRVGVLEVRLFENADGLPVDPATVDGLSVVVIPPGGGAPIPLNGSDGVYSLAALPATLLGRNPAGNWTVRVQNGGADDATVGSVDLRVVDGLTYDTYMAQINAGVPMMLLWQTDAPVLDPDNPDPDLAPLVDAPLGHYTTAVGFNTLPAVTTDPVSAAVEKVDHYTTWNQGLREWDWRGQTLSTTFWGADSEAFITADLDWSVAGAIWLQAPAAPTGLNAYYSIAHQRLGDLSLELGLGDPDDPDWSTRIVKDYAVGFNGAPYATDTGDLNGDGVDEVVTAGGNNTGGWVSVFRNPDANPGGLAGPTTIALGGPGTNTRGVSIADVNNDGRGDIIALNVGTLASGSWLTVLINDGNGMSFTASTVALMSAEGGLTGVRWGAMAVADVTGEGSPDVVLVTNQEGSDPLDPSLALYDKVLVMKNDGLGGFTPQVQRTVPVDTYMLDLGDQAGFPVALALGDVAPNSVVPGTSRTDVVLLMKYDLSTDSDVLMLKNNGIGQFTITAGSSLFSTYGGADRTYLPASIALGNVDDSDGLGLLDVITVSSPITAMGLPIVSVLPGRRVAGVANGFGAASTFRAGTGQVFSIAAADVGWDADVEIITAGNSTNRVTVWRRIDGVWTAASSYDAGKPGPLAIGQLSGGKTAIVAAGAPTSTSLTLTVIQDDTSFGIPGAYADLVNYVQPAYDLSEPLAYLLSHPGTAENWYLKVTDTVYDPSDPIGPSAINGFITDFQIRYNDQRWFTFDRDSVILQPDVDGTRYTAVARLISGIIGSISGTVYDDADADGQRDVQTAVLNPAPDGTPALPAAIADTGAEVAVPIRATGLTGNLVNVQVNLDITHPQTSDLVVKLRRRAGDGSIIGSDIVLLNHVGSGANFTGTILDDRADQTLAKGASPFTGTFGPSGALASLVGTDPNSWWELVVTDTAANGLTGQINSWSVQLTTSQELGLEGWTVTLRDSDGNNTVAVTDAAGRYSFPTVLAARYTLAVTPAADYVGTVPYSGQGLIEGSRIIGQDYGFFLPVPISGTAYHDLNRNGTLDAGELVLVDGTVFLDQDADGQLDWTDSATDPNDLWDAGEGERWVLSDADGHYVFPDVTPGAYRLRVDGTPGWVYSTPALGYYPLTVLSGQSYGGQDFGTYEPALPDLADGGEGFSGFGLASQPSSTVINPGENWQIYWRINNEGGAAAGAFTVSFYASVDADLSTTDDNYLLAASAVASLGAGAHTDIMFRGTLPAIPVGDFYVGAIIDSGATVIESQEANNTVVDDTLAGAPPVRVLLRVPGLQGTVWADRNGNTVFDTNDPAGPNDDVMVAGRTVFLDGYTDRGIPHLANGTLEWVDINNDGRWQSGEGERWTTTGYLDNNDNGVFDEGDEATGRFYFTNDLVSGSYMLPNATYRIRQVVPAGWTQMLPNTDANLATVDANIVSFPSPLSGNVVTVAFAARPGADLRNETNGTLFSGFTPGNVNVPGSTFTAWCDVRNAGTGNAGPFTVKFYASRDNDMSTTADNYLLGSVDVAGAAANSAVDVTLALAGLPSIPAGNYYVGFIIDAGNAIIESDETNNTGMDDGYPLVVHGLPDLLESPAGNGRVSPTLVHPGDNWQSTWTVLNRGGVRAGDFEVQFYASDNSSITRFDTFLGAALVRGLDPGASVDVPLTLFSFPDLPAGEYYIGVLIDAHDTDAHSMVAESVETNNGGKAMQPITVPGVQGAVFHDVNGDGIQSQDEDGLGGWRIRLYRDMDADGVLDPEDSLEAMAVSDAGGRYSFGRLSGGHFIIEENNLLGKLGDAQGIAQEAGWRQTGPTPRQYSITVDENGMGTGPNFGNVLPSLIRGTAYHDDDGSALQEAGELPAPMVEIFLDDNNNGVREDSEIHAVTDTLGMYEIRGVYPGMRILREDISSMPDTYVSDPPEGFHTLLIGSAALYAPYVFGTAGFVTIQGRLWNDLNADGAIGVAETDLQGWTVYLDSDGNQRLDPGEPSTVTDAHGLYEFTRLHPGAYRLFQVVQTGWVQSWPSPDPADAQNEPRWWFITLHSGETSFTEYGNFKLATISGTKYNDMDADGLRTPTDPGLDGWTIQLFLDDDRSRTLSRGDMLWQVTTTDPAGAYQFTAPLPLPTNAWPNIFMTNNLYPLLHFTGYPTSYVVNERMPTYVEYDVSPDGDNNFNARGQTGENGAVVQLFQDQNNNDIVDDGDYFVAQSVTGPYIHYPGGSPPPQAGSPGYYYIAGELALNVDPGNHNYILREFAITDWRQTAPAGGDYGQTVTSGQDVTGLDFGNYATVTVGGIAYDDINGDGRRQPAEPGLANWVVFLDQNRNGIQDLGETSTYTDSTGAYRFTGLRPPATYYVAQVLQSGWQKSEPTTMEYAIFFRSGENNTALNFGNWHYGQISGTKFEDVNANGTWDFEDLNINGAFDAGEVRTEPTLPGWQVALYYDTDRNGFIDPAELVTPFAQTTTDADGNYRFTSVPVGVLLVSEVPQSGWVQSYPGGAGATVTITSNETEADVNFGNYHLAEIRGVKWHDLDGDSFGPTQATFTLPAASLPAAIGDNATVDIPLTVSGLNTGILDVNVTLNITHPYASDLEIWLIAPDNTAILLVNRPQFETVHEDGDDFINTVLDDQGGSPIAGALAPFTGTFTPEEALSGLNGKDPNGVWKLRIRDWRWEDVGELNSVSLFIRSGEEEPAVSGWRIFLDENNDNMLQWFDSNHNGSWDTGEGERWVNTDSAGNYVFTGVTPGRTYRVAEVLQQGWLQTAPGGAGYLSLPLVSGQIATNSNFGNVRAGTISGVKYEDFDLDGVKDASETLLAGWQIVLFYDSSHNGTLEGDELLTPAAEGVTLPIGYQFSGLRPGLYRVSEYVQTGWVQEGPRDGAHGAGITAADGSYDIVLIGGMTAANVDFGNARTGEIRGAKWHDLDADGIKDASEPGLEGWTIYIDEDDDGVFDSGTGGEPFAITDATGNYVLPNLPPRAAAYHIREMLQDTWHQSSPSAYPDDPGDISVTVGPGQTVRNVNFGNWQYGSQSGTVYHDLNRNSLHDPNEEGLSGWIVFLDTDNDGVLDGSEPWTTSGFDDPATPAVNETGNYSFINLVPGPYTLVQEPQDGWAQTAPSQTGGGTGAQNIAIISAQNTADVDFGDVEATGRITGTVRNDVNADGVSPRRSSFAPPAASLPLAIADLSLVEQTVNITGMPGAILDVNVTLSITHPNVSDLRISLIGPDGTIINLANRVGGENPNFTATVFDDQAADSIDTAAAPFTGSFRPHTGLSHYDGLTANGVWTLRVEDLAMGNAGQLDGWSLSVWSAQNEPGLSGWTVYIDSNNSGQRDPGERGTTTGANGSYVFNGLLPGDYRVGIVVPDNWTQTYPASYRLVSSLGVAETREGVDFGAKSRPAAVDSSLDTDEDVALVSSVVADDFEDDPLTYTLVTPPAHGTVVLNSDGTYTYTPDINYNGPDQFTFHAADALSRTNPPGIVSITVRPINDRPTVNNASIVIGEDTPALFVLDGLDVETPASQLVYTATSGPSHGTLVLNGGVATYTPAANYFGPDSFTYVVTDTGDPAGVGTSPATSSLTATVTITINSINDAPVADSQTLTLEAEGGSVGILLSASDVETPLGQLTFAIDTQPLFGSVVLVGRQATYTPGSNYAGQEDSFTFTVSDGSLSAIGTVRITVLPEEMPLDLVSRQILYYVDGDGTRVRVLPVNTGAELVLSGFRLSQQVAASTITVTGASIWIKEMDLVDTVAPASVTITAGGGDGFTNVGTLTGSARLSRLVAPTVNFVDGGILMDADGTADVLQIRDLRNGADVVMPGAADGRVMSILGGRFGDGSDVTVGRPISAMTLTQFDDGSLTTPYAGSIRTTGNARRFLPGDFLADMSLTGAGRPDATAALNVASFRGSASGIWNISGRVNSLVVSRNLQDAAITITQPVDPLYPSRYAVNALNVLGMMDNVDLRTPGNINAVTAKAMTDSNVFAGVVDGTTGLPDPYSEINNPAQLVGTGPAAKINRVTITGLPAFDPVTRRMTFSYVNSNIAAYNVGTVSLRNADPLADEPFGIASWKATRMTYTDSFDAHANWTWPSPRGFSAIPAGAFTVVMGMAGVESFVTAERVMVDGIGDSGMASADIKATYMRVLGDWVYVGIATANPLAALNLKGAFRLDTNAGFGSLTDVVDTRSDFQVEFDRAGNDVTVLTGVIVNGQRVVRPVADGGAVAVVTNGGILFKVPLIAFSGYEFFQLTSTSLASPAGQVFDRSPN